jgi:nucleotide-binding universal stress UspA family protein
MEHLDARERDEMHSLLAQAAGRIRDAAGANETSITEDMVAASDIGSAIAHEAKRTGVEAIVMGSRGRSDIASLVLGSTSHKVLHLAHCPVIMVR